MSNDDEWVRTYASRIGPVFVVLLGSRRHYAESPRDFKKWECSSKCRIDDMGELMPVVNSGNVVSCAYLIQKVMSMLFQIKVQW
jgi:hypothetical protein